MSDPFRIAGPCVISVSGGRTSGLMLRRILDAYGGQLPDDVIPAFANTVREMPATLDFVRDMGAAWDVRIRWLEYRHAPTRPYFVEVSHNSASRNGEPLEALIRAKSYLPNPVTRFCTTETKIRTIKRFCKSLGWKHWTNIVGLRADEMHRVRKLLSAPARHREVWTNTAPLAAAGITRADVLAFWKAQPFDLRLAGPWEGNCDGCFLKSRAAISRMLVDHPERMAWWPEMEALKVGGAGQGSWFRSDREPYAKLAQIAADQGAFPFDETMIEGGEPCDGGCGV